MLNHCFGRLLGGKVALAALTKLQAPKRPTSHPKLVKILLSTSLHRKHLHLVKISLLIYLQGGPPDWVFPNQPLSLSLSLSLSLFLVTFGFFCYFSLLLVMSLCDFHSLA